jgi:hydrogenase nickel incorporation protein HypA/HybF
VHESALARRLVHVTLERAAAAGAIRVLAVRAWIAEPSHLCVTSLVAQFAAHAEGTIAAGATVAIEAKPVEARCTGCATTYLPDHGVCLCPRCGSPDATLLGRPGLGIDEIEVDDGDAG